MRIFTKSKKKKFIFDVCSSHFNFIPKNIPEGQEGGGGGEGVQWLMYFFAHPDA